MTELPRISGRDCVHAVSRAGFTVRRQQSSHIVLRRDDRGTLRAILRHLVTIAEVERYARICRVDRVIAPYIEALVA